MARPRPVARAFTLTELLVAIGIAAVLISLVVGAVGKVKQAAYRSSTAATIAALQGAIEQYYTNFKAYPGPISDEAVCGIVGTGLVDENNSPIPRVSMSENLVLGLGGGLGYKGNQIVFWKGLVGRGPQTLADPTSTKPMAPFYGANDQITVKLQTNDPAWGRVVGNDQKILNTDSVVPEYMDAYPETMPILYYRAHRSAQGIASDTGNVLAQYDARQNLVYLTGVNLGLSRRLGGHGLQVAGPYVIPGNRGPDYRYNLTTFMTSPNDSSAARVPDGYVLISAGPDRIYGTDDDIVSFGKVAP